MPLRPALLAALLALAPAAGAAVIVVDSGTDDGAGCTLREAVEAANADAPVGGCTAGSGLDVIRFDVPTVTLASGEVMVTGPTRLTGPVTVRGTGASRIATVASGAAVEVIRVRFEDGQAADGGALYVEAGGSASVTFGTFVGNVATNAGGAIWTAGPLVLNRTTFSTNRAGGGGGAVYTDGASVTADRSAFEANEADAEGGAVLSPNGAAVSCSLCTLEANTARVAGGAVSVVGGTLDLDRTSMVGNVGAGPSTLGGAVSATDGAVVSLVGGRIQDGRANQGGGVWAGPGVALMVDGTRFAGNLASSTIFSRGGAIYAAGTSLTVGGAAVFVRNEVNFADADVGGGAVFVGNGTATFGPGTVFANNQSYVDGGAVAVTPAEAGGSASATFTGATLRGNYARVNGGALYVSGPGASVTITGGDVSRNSSREYGAAVAIEAGATLTVDGADFTDNLLKVRAQGGGAISSRNAVLVVQNATFRGNNAYLEPGGAAYVTGGTARFVRTTMEGGRAFYGGGIYAVSTEIEISECLIAGNLARNGGGLILYSSAGRVENTTIYGNTAVNTGGGVRASASSVTFEAVTIASNSSNRSAAGIEDISADGRRRIVLRGSVMANNMSSQSAEPNLAGRFSSDGHNVIDSVPPSNVFPSQPTDQLGTDPLLLPLADNGGPTRTMGLEAGSPAIDAGAPGLDVDQRGFARDAAPDAGAFEFGATPTAAPPVAGLEAPVPGLDVFPNPAAGRATVRLAVGETQRVAVAVYDVTGRRALALFDGVLEKGLEARLPVDVSQLATGAYVVVAVGEGARMTRQITVLR